MNNAHTIETRPNGIRGALVGSRRKTPSTQIGTSFLSVEWKWVDKESIVKHLMEQDNTFANEAGGWG